MTLTSGLYLVYMNKRSSTQRPWKFCIRYDLNASLNERPCRDKKSEGSKYKNYSNSSNTVSNNIIITRMCESGVNIGTKEYSNSKRSMFQGVLIEIDHEIVLFDGYVWEGPSVKKCWKRCWLRCEIANQECRYINTHIYFVLALNHRMQQSGYFKDSVIASVSREE